MNIEWKSVNQLNKSGLILALCQNETGIYNQLMFVEIKKDKKQFYQNGTLGAMERVWNYDIKAAVYLDDICPQEIINKYCKVKHSDKSNIYNYHDCSKIAQIINDIYNETNEDKKRALIEDNIMSFCKKNRNQVYSITEMTTKLTDIQNYLRLYKGIVLNETSMIYFLTVLYPQIEQKGVGIEYYVEDLNL